MADDGGREGQGQDRAEGLLRQSIANRPYSRTGLRLRDGRVKRIQLEPGDTCLYWTGAALKTRTYDPVSKTEDEYGWICDRIAEAVPPGATIIDLGAGLGTFSIYAARRLTGLRFVNVDNNPSSLASAADLAQAFGLADRITNIQADLLNIGAIKSHISGPAYVVTFASLPYFSVEQMAALFASLVNEIGVVGGFHREALGYLTDTGRRISEMTQGVVFLKPDFSQADHTKIARAIGLRVVRDLEVPPHFLGQYLPAFFAWKAF